MDTPIFITGTSLQWSSVDAAAILVSVVANIRFASLELVQVRTVSRVPTLRIATTTIWTSSARAAPVCAIDNCTNINVD